MRRSPSETIQHLRYLLRGTGLSNTVRQSTRRVFSPLYERDTAVIAIRYLDQSMTHENNESTTQEDVKARVYESVGELDNLADDIVDPDLLSAPREHMESGPNRPVIIATAPRRDGSGVEAIGYRTFTRGEFSYWDGQLAGSMPPDCIFATDIYVLPKHRGERVFIAMRSAMQSYCSEQGIHKVVGFIKKHNAPSILAHKHNSQGGVGTINGIIRRTTLFRGLYVRNTSSDVVRSIVEGPMPARDVL